MRNKRPSRSRARALAAAATIALPQYQQTRGTLAMLAQWISIAAQEAFRKARTKPLITLGSAPVGQPGFRSVVLGQLGESRLIAAIETDIAGEQAHARALDADTTGPLHALHRRVGTAILFESSGGQTEKVAHLPELRFALGEPELDTTSIDNAAFALEDRSYLVRKVGSDGFRIGYQPTMRKVVNDRRASLDEGTEIKPALRRLVEDEFRRGRPSCLAACEPAPEAPAGQLPATLSGRARLVPQEGFLVAEGDCGSAQGRDGARISAGSRAAGRAASRGTAASGGGARGRIGRRDAHPQTRRDDPLRDVESCGDQGGTEASLGGRRPHGRRGAVRHR